MATETEKMVATLKEVAARQKKFFETMRASKEAYIQQNPDELDTHASMAVMLEAMEAEARHLKTAADTLSTILYMEDRYAFMLLTQLEMEILLAADLNSRDLRARISAKYEDVFGGKDPFRNPDRDVDDAVVGLPPMPITDRVADIQSESDEDRRIREWKAKNLV
jgi:hypothetical protein